MMKKKYQIYMSAILAAAMLASCEKPVPEPEPEPEPEVPVIELVSPEDNASLEIAKDMEISFSWKKAEGISNYKLSLSVKENMDDAYTVAALQNPLVFSGKEFDAALESAGVLDDNETVVYWSIIPFSTRTEATTQVRKLKVKRMGSNPGGHAYANAETIVHKIGIYYEDMTVVKNGESMPLHRACNWADPHQQSKDLARYMTEASHGVVKYEIAVEIDGTVPYAYYYEEGHGQPVGTLMTAQLCYDECFLKGTYPGIGEGVRYDYAKMITDNGFDEMMNDGRIDEVWVYNHPAAGMYETCMAGPGAFWINGSTFQVPSLKRQCTVLFCNYERTVDLAMHSLAHKFENVMKKVYGDRWAYTAASEKGLNNWERFSAYNVKYDKYDKGCSHIGNCHFPCNAVSDYSYESRSYVKSYCDAWNYYPNLVMDETTCRTINCSEWGSNQLGYMKWFFSHVPHFEGINEDPNDYHLNNWWYYFIDYTAAKAYEAKLIRELM